MEVCYLVPHNALNPAVPLHRLITTTATLILLCILFCPGRADAQQTNSASLYLDALLDFERHAETIWSDANYTNAPAGSGYFGDGNSDGNGGIRGSCGVAVAYAVLVRALPADPQRTLRIDRIRKALNYAANTHISAPTSNVCKDGKRWGHGWQSALWSGSMGFACLLVQDELPVATVQACQSAVADEATYRAGIAPASGYIGDTKAEENGWNSNVLALSAAWMTSHTNFQTWRMAAKKYLVNTYTVPDTTGDPLASWVTTITLFPGFGLENHGFYHPSYQMVSGMSMGDSYLMARLASAAIASDLRPFAEHNVTNVWNHLNHMLLDSGEFAYPSGLDWALHSYEQNSYYAWIATHFDNPLARQADARLAQLVRQRQIVNGDGRFVGESEANGFYREAVEARRTAFAWLHHTHGIFTNGALAEPPPHISHFADLKLISQRSSAGFVSLSYGAKIMGLIIPPVAGFPTNIYVTTPRNVGLLGQGALGLPTSAALISFTTNAFGFEAKLQLQHGVKGNTVVSVKTSGDAVAIIEVPWPNVATFATNVGSFTIGIENHALTGSSRLIEWAGGSSTVVERSGVTRNITNDWLAISGQLGCAAGPAGFFRYKAATSYNRLGAAEDILEFIPHDPFAPRYSIWFPGRNADETANRAAQVSWTVSETNAVLAFPGVDGQLQEMDAILPPPLPSFAPYPVPVSGIAALSSQSAYPPALAVDGDLNTFWVSNEAPRTNSPQWLEFTFLREVAVSGIQFVPRLNYGPRSIEIRVGTNLVFAGAMTNGPLTLQFPKPVRGSNARLTVLWSFDPQYPANPAAPRNVQLAEAIFFERAVPDSFKDWVLQKFEEADLTNENRVGLEADPDNDEIGNLLEYVTGGEPLLADSASARLETALSENGNIAVRFRERKNIKGYRRQFQTSPNMFNWTNTDPIEQLPIEEMEEALVLEAVLQVGELSQFFRIRYDLAPDI